MSRKPSIKSIKIDDLEEKFESKPSGMSELTARFWNLKVGEGFFVPNPDKKTKTNLTSNCYRCGKNWNRRFRRREGCWDGSNGVIVIRTA